jgi:hypothetical protein
MEKGQPTILKYSENKLFVIAKELCDLDFNSFKCQPDD